MSNILNVLQKALNVTRTHAKMEEHAMIMLTLTTALVLLDSLELTVKQVLIKIVYFFIRKIFYSSHYTSNTNFYLQVICVQKSLAKMVEPVMMEKLGTLVIVHLDMKDLTVKQVIVRMIYKKVKT